MTLFGIAALLAPVVGPTLGGYITDNYGWRWIFYLNVPVGLLALVMCSAVVVGSGLSEGRAAPKMREQPPAVRHARPVPAERDDGLLGDHAEQRAGMGLVRRSVLSRADAAGPVRRLPRAA